jgi:hypothetical protein
MNEGNLIPAGQYKAVAVQVDVDGVPTFVQFGTTKGNDGKAGTKQVLVQFEILEGVHAGRRVPWWGYFSEKAWENTVKGLRACGFKGDDLAALPAQQLDQEVSIVVGVNEWNGKKNNRVEWVNASSGGIKLAAPMNGNDLRQFSAFMKSRAAKVPAVEGKKAEKDAPASANDEPPPPTDSDVPF